MSVPVPVAGFLSAQFMCAGIRYIKWLEKVVKVFGVRNLKNEFLQGFGIFKCVVYGFIKTFDMEMSL